MSTNRPNRSTQPTAPIAAGDRPSWGEGWGIGLHVWIERAGQSILGPGRLELLESIDRHHSISAAARTIGMSYRRAWELVQSINEGAGEPLVIAETGGVHGGGAQLTPLGRWAIAVFRDMQEQLHERAARLLPQLVRPTGRSVLHVAAAVSLEEVVGQLLNDFALQVPSVRVRAVYGGSDELADYLLAGAPGDLFLTADPHQFDQLRAANLLRQGQPVSLAENGLAAIGLAAGDLIVRRPADLGCGDCRVALADPDCPLGAYTRTYLERLRLYEPLRQRAIWVENSRSAVAAVRAGQADAAIVYSSDAFRAEGCRALFRARRLPVPILYRGAVLHRGDEPTAAQQLLAFLSSPQSARRYRQCGFLAVQRHS